MSNLTDLGKSTVRVRPGRIFSALLAASLLYAAPALAQYTIPPDEGGEIKSMGQPPVWKPNMAVEAGGYYKGDASDFVGYLNLGVLKDLFNPVAGALAVQAEGYIGTQGPELNGGFKGLLLVPFFSFGTGLDYNFGLDRLDLLLRIQIPLARGGLMGMGGSVQANWLPWRGQLTLGAQVPLLQPWAGQTRSNLVPVTRNLARHPYVKEAAECPGASASLRNLD